MSGWFPYGSAWTSATPFARRPADYATPLSSTSTNNTSDDSLAGSHSSWRSYDYVVVGGGTAGCVLASRLSENPDITVLLLEAGKPQEDDILSRIPMAAAKMFRGPSDWNYETTSQKELGDRKLHWARGKILGGSSSMNFMVYHHCTPEDFNSWERLGAQGWSYESMKKYFAKSERHVPNPTRPLDPSSRGKDGPVITQHIETAPIVETFLQAAANLGIPPTEDFNTSPGTLGDSAFLGCVDELHERCSTSRAYLPREVLQRPNLTVATEVTTEKIIFSEDRHAPPAAVGVQICTTSDSPRFVVGARKEVILCAGAVGSPQLLMLSGIGPASRLTEVGVPVVRDMSQVGQNLYDHLMPGPVSFRAKPGATFDSAVYAPIQSLLSFLRWRVYGTGPLSSIPVPAAVFVRSDDPNLPYGDGLSVVDTTTGPGAPDIEIGITPFAVTSHDTIKPPPGTYGFTMGAAMLRPQSTGSIRLRSASIFDHPVIDPNYLSTPSDWNGAIRATRLVLRLARTPPLSDWLDVGECDTHGDSFAMGARDPDEVTEDELRKYIQERGRTAWHPTSTARMGKSEEDSVVDSELRVHGVHGLRVVDASVFPEQVSGHPTAVIIAMAERAADLIKNEMNSHT
ncbi:GMC oxidoreductase [Daedaleopsis nitida]|nr:GMC oxidoreductase [Daedaleopsis nitida]